jgi:5-methylcytosine-specific restriction enzyme subunit McrC
VYDSIPIQNIYYLLCYAWNKLDEGETLDLNVLDESPNLVDLFAHVLSSGVQRLIRRGFDRDYISFTTRTSRIRGRINFSESIKQNLLTLGRPQCEFDELSYDVLHNQILKTTIHNLLNVSELHPDHRSALRDTEKWLRDVRLIRLSKQDFRRVQLHRNNNFYRFLLNVCELVYDSLLVDENTGQSRFRDFVRDPHKLRGLFEEFVRNFYKTRQNMFSVTSPKLRWNAETHDTDSSRVLPEMRTDICLTNAERQILIDCKFSKSVLSTYREKKSLKPPHLYQLYTYLCHAKTQFGWSNVEGVLLYPTVNDRVNYQFRIDSFPIEIRTIDLNQDWQKIELDLLGIIS